MSGLTKSLTETLQEGQDFEFERGNLTINAHRRDIEVYYESHQVYLKEVPFRGAGAVEPTQNLVSRLINAEQKASTAMQDDINGWEYNPTDEHLLRWTTNNGLEATVTQSRTGTFEITRPILGLGPFRCSTFESAKFQMVYFLLGTSAQKADYRELKRQCLYENLQELPGIGESRASDIIEEGYTTCEDLLDNLRQIPSNYKSDLKAQLKQIQQSDKPIYAHEKLAEKYPKKMLSESI